MLDVSQGQWPLRVIDDNNKKDTGICWLNDIILLMVQKSCTSWYVAYSIIDKVLYIPGGAGFLPSTVCLAVSILGFTAQFFVTLNQILKEAAIFKTIKGVNCVANDQSQKVGVSLGDPHTKGLTQGPAKQETTTDTREGGGWGGWDGWGLLQGWVGWVGWVGWDGWGGWDGMGGVGGMITFLGLAHILECGWWVGGWRGWDDNVPWTCTHTRVRVVGWVGGWGGMITFPGLAHILECGVVGGWGGWDDNVPWTCTHTRVWVVGG